MIKINNLNKQLISKKAKHPYTIFKNFPIHIEREKVTVITGESGSGKTTLLNIMSFLDHDFSANFQFNGRNVKCLTERKRAKIRRENIGFVFQNYALIPELTIMENVMLPLRLLKTPKKIAKKRADEVLKRVGITKDLDHDKNEKASKKIPFWDKYPFEASGGQLQRIGIARALIHNPNIIFCDEPTGNLDDDNTKSVMDYLLEYQRADKERTLVIVTHNKDIVSFADRHFELKKTDGQPTQIIEN